MRSRTAGVWSPRLPEQRTLDLGGSLHRVACTLEDEENAVAGRSTSSPRCCYAAARTSSRVRVRISWYRSPPSA